MDEKLLSALGNLSESLEMIAEALKEKGTGGSSSTATALRGGDFSVQIKEINEGIKSIKSDTKQILANQKTLLEISKQKSNEKHTGLFEKAGGDKNSENNLKKGVGTIMLIAVAVLAIGLAFKVIGNVDFISVVGLSLAILVISHAFEKIGSMKMTLKEAFNVSTTMVMMAGAITVSSWILSLVATLSGGQILTTIAIATLFYIVGPKFAELSVHMKNVTYSDITKTSILLVAISLGIMVSSWALSFIIPMSISQMVTGVMITLMFSIVAHGLPKIVKSIKDISYGDILKVGFILPIISIGIMFSSWILSLVMPMSIPQALTAILIAGMFTIISFGLPKIAKAVKGMDISDVLIMGLVLPAVALAITISSWFLQGIKPITFPQALTAIMIAGLFIVISFGLGRIAKAVKDLTIEEMIKIGAVMPLVSLAITISSHILSGVKSITINQFLTSLGITLLFLVASFAISLISKEISKMKWVDVLKIPALFTLVSLAIMVSSHILNKSADIDFMKMAKILAFSVVMAIAVAAVGMVSYLLNKVGVTNILKGLLGVIAISGAIMVSSHILAVGNYSEYPSLKWAIGTGASILAFGLAAVALGTVMSTGIGASALALGALAVVGVALTITLASHILSKGSYSKFPSLEWSTSVALSLGAFALGMTVLGGLIVGSFGLGALALAAGSAAVLMVARTIVKSSYILATGKWTKGPTKEWAQGVAISLGAFMPVYEMLLQSKSLWSTITGGGVTPAQFTDAIKTVSKGITTAANYFAKNPGVWKNAPTKEWAQGVGTAIGAFAPVYKILMANSGIWKSGVSVKDFITAISMISYGIIKSASIFASNKSKFIEGSYPSENWGKGVGSALNAFAPIFKQLSGTWFESGGDTINNMVNGIVSISRAIVRVGSIFSKSGIKWTSYPTSKWSFNINQAIKKMNSMYMYLDANPYGVLSKIRLNGIVDNIISIAKKISRNSKYFNNEIDPNFMKSLGSNIMYYNHLSNMLMKQQTPGAILKKMVGGDPITNVANGMVKLAKAYDKLSKSITSMNASVNQIDAEKLNALNRLTTNIAVMSVVDSAKLNEAFDIIDKKSNVFSHLIEKQEKTMKKGASVSNKTSGVVKKKEEPTEIEMKKMVKLLSKLVSSTSKLDWFIKEKLSESGGADLGSDK